MYHQILQQMRSAVQAGRIRLSHALDELDEDHLSTADALHCVLTGEIVEDQYDLRYAQTKYVIYGDTQYGDEMGMVARFDHSSGIVIITVYRLRISDYD